MADVQDIIAFFTSLQSCLVIASRDSEDANAKEYVCRKLEGHFHVVFALQSVIESKFGHEELKSLFENLVRELHILVSEVQSQCREQLPYNRLTLSRQFTGGRPKYVVSKEQIETLRETGMNWKSIAETLGINERTLYNYRQELNISQTFSEITDAELKSVIESILQQTPYAGETYIRGGLVARQIFVQRNRVRECLRLLDPVGRAVRKRVTIQRRMYNVAASNELWHVDTNHKLIQWRFVVHGCIDGYSRAIIYLKCSTNNLATTAVQFFIEGNEKFGVPSRVRADRGVENVEIAKFMITTRGTGRGSFIAGTSVHNQRIERLWREVNRVLGALYKDLFITMENSGLLDVDNEAHLLALEIVFLPRINASLREFESQWNYHGLRTMGHRSPMTLWYSGNIPNQVDELVTDFTFYGVDFDGDIPDIETDNNIVVPEGRIILSPEQWSIVHNTVPNPVANDGNYGINFYCAALQTLTDIL